MSTSGRGLGHKHQQMRKIVARAVDAGEASCTICTRWIKPGSRWDLHHTEDRTGYYGPAHSFCNRSEGGRRGRAVQLARSNGFKVSRAW